MKLKHFLLVLFSVFFYTYLMVRQYHVSLLGSNSNKGTLEAPFRTISQAIRKAMAGDSVLIHAGTYREWTSSFVLDKDFLGKERNSDNPIAGPIEY